MVAETKVILMKALSLLTACAVLCACSGCSTNQIHSTVEFIEISLDSNALETYGLGFITPSAVTGQEEDKQTLALIFAKTIKQERPDIRLVTLPETLSAVNGARMADEYKRMYDDYRDTGIFEYESLKKIGQITGVRYLAQLKLANFSQRSKERLSLLGLRIFQTKEANIRVFFQIWDSENGSIAWEGIEELNHAWDTGSEKPVTFKLVVSEIALNLVSKLP